MTLALNANEQLSARRVAALESGFEFHGPWIYAGPNAASPPTRPMPSSDSVETIAKFAGKRPRSWESPGLTETEEALDLLRLNGIEYVADWVIDDLPQDILSTPHGTITTIPYLIETNDIVIHVLQHLLFGSVLKPAPTSSTGSPSPSKCAE